MAAAVAHLLVNYAHFNISSSLFHFFQMPLASHSAWLATSAAAISQRYAFHYIRHVLISAFPFVCNRHCRFLKSESVNTEIISISTTHFRLKFNIPSHTLGTRKFYEEKEQGSYEI